MTKVTVVIPNFNGIKYLPGCLKALEQQVHGTPDFDVIVIDNGSGDGSAEYLKEYLIPESAKAFKKLTPVFLEENTGFCHAVNVGIQNSRAPFVILLNNDTEVYPDFVSKLYEAVSGEGSEKIFSGSAMMLTWDDENVIDDCGDRYTVLGWAYGRGKGKDKGAFEKPSGIFSACGGAAIYKREVFEEIGLFDEAHFAYFEDLDIGYRALINGYKNIFVPGAKVKHFGSASSGSRYNGFKARLSAENSVYVPFKNMPLFQYIINLPFLIIGCVIKTLFYVRKGLGREYVSGLLKGIKKSFSKQGFSKKVYFKWKNLPALCVIQIKLCLNTVLMLFKR
ncbi:MAG: glycosyltransferase family 2 protein [Lachnospiraceae bacterium]|nr:glycosyltransferase family 2 protein [Lachnospiraceae bacterium]